MRENTSIDTIFIFIGHFIKTKEEQYLQAYCEKDKDGNNKIFN